MTDWVTIEHIAFRQGPRDGDQLKDVGARGLVASISVPAGTSTVCRYRKTGEFEQIGGAGMVEPYARVWLYDWLPDPTRTPTAQGSDLERQRRCGRPHMAIRAASLISRSAVTAIAFDERLARMMTVVVTYSGGATESLRFEGPTDWDVRGGHLVACDETGDVVVAERDDVVTAIYGR